MVDEITKLTKLIENYEDNYKLLRAEYQQLENELIDLEKKIEHAHDFINDYMNTYNVKPTLATNLKPGSLVNKSYPEMVVEIAKNSNGLFNIADAVEILLREKVDTDKKSIQRNIYTALYRLKNHFVRLENGQYRFTNHIDSPKRTSSPKHNVGHRDRTYTGLRQEVKRIKDATPQMTKDEVFKYLIDNKWDFKGKKAMNALNITWGFLGYSKEGKQQELIPSIIPGEVTGVGSTITVSNAEI
jgi:thiamine kinase-like enzyme